MSAPTPERPPRPELIVPVDELRWRCDDAWVAPFPSTDEIEPIHGVIGQDDAIESLRFGLEIHAPGQNIFVRGLAGTGRLTLLERLLEEVRLACPIANDLCYVHDFERGTRPKLLILPRGQAQRFAARVDGLIEFIGEELLPALTSESLRDRRNALADQSRVERESLTSPFEKQLAEQGLTLVTIPAEPNPQMAIVPLIDGQPTPPEAFDALVSEGKVTEQEVEDTMAAIAKEIRAFESIALEVEDLKEKHRARVHSLFESEVRKILGGFVRSIAMEFKQESARKFLDAIVNDVVSHRLGALSQGGDTEFTLLYEVNVVSDHTDGSDCPVVVESHPSLSNLFGGVEREYLSGGGVRTDHRGVRVGSVVRADGGYLLLEARELISEPGAWRALKRFLRSGKAEIAVPNGDSPTFGPTLEPESPAVSVKVVLMGDPDLYYALDAEDRDFSHLFKVLADFETTLPRNEEAVANYAGVLARIVKDEKLVTFSSSAIAALAEHGARIAGRNDRLTTRFGRLADIAREGSFIASKDPKPRVERSHVERAIANTKRRADLPARRFRRLVTEGTIRVATRGSEIGQVNGLAVVHAGPLTYGFPTRITATIGPGTAGAINIEREAQLSGSIHTKGFYILGGLLRHILRSDHPLAFSASIAFEQTYGGIDGDSASGAEMCCLLSALTEIPLRQDRAMTGAIDQLGHIQPIGAANEKIEGFFDICNEIGLTGEQGVIIPRSNVPDLMLRPTVVEACREGQFQIFAVDTIGEALEIFTDLPAGERGADGRYPQGTLFSKAVERAAAFWEMIRARPEPR
mgnify:CR=1 FL=1